MNKRTWSWVLSANFSEGLPYTIINTVLVALLADMGVSKTLSAMIPSLLALPWIWKFTWSPFIDTYSTKRRWMLAMQLLLATLLVTIGLCLGSDNWLAIVVICSTLCAVASASYDVSCDGYYMLALTQEQQSFFVGIRSTAYRLGMLFASGYLMILAKEGTTEAWSRTFYIIGALMLALTVLHLVLLPKVEGETKCDYPKADTTITQAEDEKSKNASATPTCTRGGNPLLNYWNTVKSFYQLHHGKELLMMLLFILTYRLGEAFLSKVTILFLKDDVVNGGLNLNNEQYGWLYGTFGTLALVIGGILGGICISKFGLRHCLIPMVLALDLPDLLYVYLAQTQSTSLPLIGSCVTIEQFGYGFGFTAFTVYLLQCAKGPYETAHYSFLTALMAFGILIPSTISGYVQDWFGNYEMYFIMACLLTIPGIIMSLWLFFDLKRQSVS